MPWISSPGVIAIEALYFLIFDWLSVSGLKSLLYAALCFGHSSLPSLTPERENREYPQVSTILDLIGADWDRRKLNTCLLQIFGKPPPLP
jgi:hypothetical protein